MRVIIVLAALAICHGAKLERTYLPPSNAPTAGGSGNFLQTPFSQGDYYSQNEPQANNNINFGKYNEGRPERPRAALERNAAILRQDSSNNGETYSYAYETENGIYAEESGVATNGVEAQGGYSYTGDDGQVYSVRYTADQNGFVPVGDHLPTPPPVPEEILKALEKNARDEAAGIYDDGSYNEDKYSADNNSYNYQQNTPSSSGVAPIYGAPNAPIFNAAKNISPVYVAPNVLTFNGNAPAFTTARASNIPSVNVGRTSSAEKAYLPPFADQRSQAKNSFGSRQQSFNSRTGYNY